MSPKRQTLNPFKYNKKKSVSYFKLITIQGPLQNLTVYYHYRDRIQLVTKSNQKFIDLFFFSSENLHIYLALQIKTKQETEIYTKKPLIHVAFGFFGQK